MSNPAILSLTDVGRSFGAIKAVSGVSLDLFERRIYALIGPNGAGKTTLLNIISGYIGRDSGNIRLRGQLIDDWPASRRVHQGMARSFQIAQLFSHMTAMENVMCGFHLHVDQSLLSVLLGLRSFAAEERSLRDRARQLLEMVGVGDYAEEPAGLLPFGLQRRLEVARALATQPSLLLLDEPCAGLSGPETAEFGRLLQRLAGEGMCVLVIEHDMPFVLEVADEVVVLDAGEIIARGTPDAIRNDPCVIEAYLGELEHGAA
ncbi:MAG: ABC transporter ATP-binding protein [Bradyrhizobiaceae bacterium]|nr:ABC transporter ATP-binding protein [Bradyrhizobiaceae bacterium]